MKISHIQNSERAQPTFRIDHISFPRRQHCFSRASIVEKTHRARKKKTTNIWQFTRIVFDAWMTFDKCRLRLCYARRAKELLWCDIEIVVLVARVSSFIFHHFIFYHFFFYRYHRHHLKPRVHGLSIQRQLVTCERTEYGLGEYWMLAWGISGGFVSFFFNINWIYDIFEYFFIWKIRFRDCFMMNI